IAPDNNFGLRPNFGAKPGERLSIFFGAAPGQKNPGARNFPGQLSKHRSQFIRRGQTKICRWQFSLVEDSQIRTAALDQDPGCLGAASFDAEDFFAAVHCRSFTRLYHGSWLKTRPKPPSESSSSGANLEGTIAVITRKPLRQSATANTIGSTKSSQTWKPNIPN